MAQFKLTDNAVVGLTRGNGGWTNLNNTVAGAYNTVLVYGGVFNNANVTVSDFLNCGPTHGASGSQANNVTRRVLTGVTFTAGSAGKPYWDADDLNIPVSGGTCDCNYIAIYQMSPGTTDADRNVICIGDLSSQSVGDSTNLVIIFAATGILQGDDPNT